jgi:hypothetical protein
MTAPTGDRRERPRRRRSTGDGIDRPETGLIRLPLVQPLPFGQQRWRLPTGGLSDPLASRAW